MLPFEYVINGDLVTAEPLYVELLKEKPSYKDDAELVLLGNADKLNIKNNGKSALLQIDVFNIVEELSNNGFRQPGKKSSSTTLILFISGS